MTDRIATLMDQLGTALREMRRNPESRDRWSTEMATIVRARPGITERAFFLSVAVKAAPDEVFDQMIADCTSEE